MPCTWGIAAKAIHKDISWHRREVYLPNSIREWTTNQKYQRGEIVSLNKIFWQARCDTTRTPHRSEDWTELHSSPRFRGAELVVANYPRNSKEVDVARFREGVKRSRNDRMEYLNRIGSELEHEIVVDAKSRDEEISLLELSSRIRQRFIDWFESIKRDYSLSSGKVVCAGVSHGSPDINIRNDVSMRVFGIVDSHEKAMNSILNEEPVMLVLARAQKRLLRICPQSAIDRYKDCLLYTSPSPRDRQKSRMPSSA